MKIKIKGNKKKTKRYYYYYILGHIPFDTSKEKRGCVFSFVLPIRLEIIYELVLSGFIGAFPIYWSLSSRALGQNPFLTLHQ